MSVVMKVLHWLLSCLLLFAHVDKALRGPGTSSRRKRGDSSDSEDWEDFSLNLCAKNEVQHV